MFKQLDGDLELILSKTSNFWDQARNKTFFITGGTGFFGIWMQMSFIYINKKLKLNSKLILLTRDKEGFITRYPWLNNYNEISFLQGDINNFEFIPDKIDYIIHAATEASVKLNIEQPLEMFETVVNGTKRILDFSRIKKVKSFLLTSSGAVYGHQPSSLTNINEEYIGGPLTSDPSSVYGEGKRMSEVLCTVYHKHYNVPVKIARCYAFVGPFLPLDSHFAVGNFIKNLLDKQDVVIEGDGTPTRSYMYAADLMIWLWTILFKGEDNRAYNVGSPHSISILELARLVLNLDSNSNTEIIVKTPISNKSILRYVPDVKRAQTELGLEQYTEIESALQKTFNFYNITHTEYVK